jgi:hypothetical protein
MDRRSTLVTAALLAVAVVPAWGQIVEPAGGPASGSHAASIRISPACGVAYPFPASSCRSQVPAH